MEYVSESPNHCSKGVLQYVQNYTNIHGNKGFGHMFEKNCLSLHHQFRRIVACYNKQKGKKKLTFPIFDNKLLSSSKNWKLALNIVFFQIKHEDMCDYNPQCFMSGGLILDDIIVNIFSETTE